MFAYSYASAALSEPQNERFVGVLRARRDERRPWTTLGGCGDQAQADVELFACEQVAVAA